MGVPALFRWLSTKYPKIVSSVLEETPAIEGQNVDLLGLNPNGHEFDCLYLDMNGIIHPCCHPEGKKAPETEDEMMCEIFKYIDRIFAMVRPRRLLYLAIDGVAPRAKMNQQRSRRFRAAQEAKTKTERGNELQNELRVGDEDAEKTDDTESAFDSNCITPGTPFMDLIARSLRLYILDRVNREPAWQQITVILSDANVPGEGEHKIVDYIRKQRLEPGYDPNMEHVIYGLDADLIMLSMATHEPRFNVLREDVFAEERARGSAPSGNCCYNCNRPGHQASACPEKAVAESGPKPFIFLSIPILREYLEAELQPARPLPFAFDFERVIDDWIFLCFFVGNDFLPHLPCLELREGAIDTLINIYKGALPRLGGFICDGGRVDLARAQAIMEGLARVEPAIFQKRQLKEDRRLENISRRKTQADRSESAVLKAAAVTVSASVTAAALSSVEVAIETPRDAGQSGSDILHQQRLVRQRNIEAAKALKSAMSATDSDAVSVVSEASSAAISISTSATIASEAPDTVRLWESGARERYYVSKFGIEPVEVDAFAQKVARAYVEGLCWVLAYYYRGCPSWKWFYPYHYAPFAADLVAIADLQITFELGEPFRPFDQLMAVFPAASRVHIPAPFHQLMLSEDSPIIDFYPEDFDIDMNGKRAAWQGVALLPFIDEARLLRALEGPYAELTTEETQRNKRGDSLFYAAKGSVLGSWVGAALQGSENSDSLLELPVDAPFGAQVAVDPCAVSIGGQLASHLEAFPDVQNTAAVSARFRLHSHAAKDYFFDLLPGAQLPRRILTDEDIRLTRSGALARNFPNILDYGRGGSGGGHSMHRETRDRMAAADGLARGNKRNLAQVYTASTSFQAFGTSPPSEPIPSNPDSGSAASTRFFAEEASRFAHYAPSNIPGPYDFSNSNEKRGPPSSSSQSGRYSSRYHRRN